MSAGNKHAWRVFWSHTPTWSAGRENTVYCMQIGIRFHIRFWPLIIGKYRNKIKFVFKIWRIFPDRWDPNFRFDLLPNFCRITWFARHENIFAQHLRNLSDSKLRYNYANKYLIGLILIVQFIVMRLSFGCEYDSGLWISISMKLVDNARSLLDLVGIIKMMF